MTTKKAILTRFIGATENRPPRIAASDGDGNRITIKYPADADLDFGEPRYRKAAEALCEKMGWDSSTLIGGWLKPDHYVFVFNED
jgi:hypothetical protein